LTESPLLEIADVNVRFGGIHAVRDVTLAVSPGQVYGVIGPNGAGKTTLFDAIFGYARLSSGSINLRGEDITQRSASWRARRGMHRTFQRQQTVGSLTVADNVLVGTEWHGGGGSSLGDLVALPWRRRIERERREVVGTVMEWCGLKDFAGVKAQNLSIGHARLLELARAIVDQPLILLLDEPTSGMSPPEVEKVRSVMALIRKNFGTTILIIEHDVNFIMSECDRIMVLNLGSVVADGTPDEIRNDEHVKSSYFGAVAGD
jgi:branched-chain amino acid transport system ATP-binding protein